MNVSACEDLEQAASLGDAGAEEFLNELSTD
jgi:hypothetical protein